MKKIKVIVFSLLINLFFIINVNAASNPYSSTSSYGVNCTWYAWNMAYQKAGVALPGWGNAKDWYNDAINSGYSVGSTPRANSIVVWGTWTSYGHVGYVESVSGNTLYVWDSASSCIVEDEEYKNCIANGVSQESDIACRNNAKQGPCAYSTSDYYVTGYIYLDTPPKTVASSSSTTTTQTVQEEVKSNNSYLSSITLSSGEIEFNKDVLNYDITVDNNVDKINIAATSEDEKATITGLGDYDLEVGINIIFIDVTAEDSSTKEYIVSITREEEVKEEKVVTKKETNKEAEENNKQNINIYSSIIGFIIIFTILIIIIKKHKRRKIN